MARHVAHEDITLIANRKNVKNRKKMLGYFCKFSYVSVETIVFFSSEKSMICRLKVKYSCNQII